MCFWHFSTLNDTPVCHWVPYTRWRWHLFCKALKSIFNVFFIIIFSLSPSLNSHLKRTRKSWRYTGAVLRREVLELLQSSSDSRRRIALISSWVPPPLEAATVPSCVCLQRTPVTNPQVCAAQFSHVCTKRQQKPQQRRLHHQTGMKLKQSGGI